MHVSIEFSLAGVLAIVLFFVAGKNNSTLNAVLLVLLFGFCLHPLLSLSWITNARPQSIKIWRIAAVTAFTIIGVFGLWVWPTPAKPEHEKPAAKEPRQLQPNLVFAGISHPSLYRIRDEFTREDRAKRPYFESPHFPCVLVGIKNAYRNDGSDIVKARNIKAELIVKLSNHEEQFGPLAWLGTIVNHVTVSCGETEHILLAANLPTGDPNVADWRIPVQPRSEYHDNPGVERLQLIWLQERSEADVVLRLSQISDNSARVIRTFTGKYKWPRNRGMEFEF